MTIRIRAAIGFGTSVLVAARQSNPVEATQPMRIRDTPRLDFPAGGKLRLRHPIVEAWNRPGAQITTVNIDPRGKETAMRQPQRVHVMAERSGNEVIVTESSARFGGFPLEYYIKVPAVSRVVDCRHGSRNVNIDRLTGDIDVSLRHGEILLRLPQEGQYSIHAKSTFGNVNSDWSGGENRGWWFGGRRSMSEIASSPQKLNLKVGYGDIVLLRTRVAKLPELMLPAPKRKGLGEQPA